MIKRISCNVIDSKLLRNATSVALVPAIRPNNTLPNAGLHQTSNPGKTYELTNLTLKISNYPIGQILDCTV